MRKSKQSLYSSLAIVIIIAVTIIISINSTYQYLNIKDRTIEDIKKNSRETILTLKKNLSTLISAYAINEYDKLILNEIQKKQIFAIIVEDYNMGEIVGKPAYITGKIRDKNWQVENYNIKNKIQLEELENCFYKDSFKIISKDKEVGKVTIYISNKNLNEKLKEIIIETIKNTIIISILLVLVLFLAIKYFVLKPISNIMDIISITDKDGIPISLIPLYGSKEINALSVRINNMIKTIKESRFILKENENRLQYLLELSPIAVRIAKDRGEIVVFANKAYSNLIKTSKEKTYQKNPIDYYKDKKDYQEVLEKLENNQDVINKLINLNIQGKDIWVLSSYMNIKFKEEASVIGWFYDVTKEKELQKLLEQQKNEFEAIFKYAKDGLALLDLESNFIDFNEAYLKMTGFTREELLTKSCLELTSSEDFQKAKEVFETILENNYVTNFEKTCIVKDGKAIRINMSLVLLPEKNMILISAKDVTQLKLLESQSKLASMGEMIGNIAHQWRQPLNIISTIASSVKVRNEFGTIKLEEILEDMNSIINQTQYLSRTIDDFRNFIKNTNKKDKLSIVNTVKKALSIINSTMVNNNIILINNLEDDINIEGFENQLIQAFINIINNSNDALKENIDNEEDRVIFIETKKINDKNLSLSIKDSGKGIKKEFIDKIFEPYFTTKHQSIGTGIGLSMTYQIITENHHSEIKVSNESFIYNNKTYTGACFTIIFNT